MDPGTLEANRRGELTEAQRARMRRRFRSFHLVGVLYVGMIAWMGYLMRASLASMWPVLVVAAVFFGAIYYFAVFRLAARGLADVEEGRVETTSGTPRLWRDLRAGGWVIHVDGKALRLEGTNAAGAKLLRSGAAMRFHHLPRSLYVLTFETAR